MEQKPSHADQPKRKRRWSQFSLRTLMIGVTLVAAWVGWQLHVERQRNADEADACEAVLRPMLEKSRGTPPEQFISFGTDELGNRLDPPPGFIDRFADLGVRLKMVSAARLPGRDEKTADGCDRAVEDRATGATGSIVSAKVERWLDDHTIQVFVERYRGWSDSAGRRATVEKRNGHWQVTATFDDFVS